MGSGRLSHRSGRNRFCHSRHATDQPSPSRRSTELTMPRITAKKTQSEYERFMALSDAEKDAEVSIYDKALPLGANGLPGKPLRTGDKTLHQRAAARGAGRPRVGKGAKIVPVSIE